MARLFPFFAACVMLFSGQTVWGQHFGGYRSGLIPNNQAQQYDLERVWFTQVAVNRAQGEMRHMLYYVSSVDAYTLHEVTYDNRRQVFTEHDLDPFKEPLGPEGSKKKAEEFVEDLKELEVEGKLTTHVVPEITIYAATSQGVIHAIDGETGRTRWAKRIGEPGHPMERPAASEKYLGVVSGSQLYLLDRKTGNLLWTRQIQGVPGAGPAISDFYAIVPTMGGNVELYELEDTEKLPDIYKSNGRALIQPLSTPLSIAWPTDRGFMYVARASKRGLRFRLEAKDAITAPPVYAPPGRIITGSRDGYVYCVNESSGDLIWGPSTGEPISQSPVPVDKSVYVITEEKNLFCLNLEDGEEKWWSPQIVRFLSASKDRLYCIDSAQRLTVLDAKTGGRIGSLPTALPDMRFVNLQTDRIFLGSKSGMIQCLRESEMRWPLVHAGVEKIVEEKKKEEKQPLAGGGASPQKQGGGNDPFGAGGGGGGGNDPFGAGGGGGGGNDPFGAGGGGGGGNDPFGAGGGGNDPFGAGGGGGGGGNDPFGAGGGGGNDPFGN